MKGPLDALLLPRAVLEWLFPSNSCYASCSSKNDWLLRPRLKLRKKFPVSSSILSRMASTRRRSNDWEEDKISFQKFNSPLRSSLIWVCLCLGVHYHPKSSVVRVTVLDTSWAWMILFICQRARVEWPRMNEWMNEITDWFQVNGAKPSGMRPGAGGGISKEVGSLFQSN